MKHFYQKIEGGWFNFPQYYAEVVKKAEFGHFVEVGAYTGQSTVCLAVEIINSRKDIRLDVVDMWSTNHPDEELVAALDGVKQY